MNFLNIKSLEKKLTENNVSEKEGFYYLLANWVVFGFISFITVDKQHDNPGVIIMLIIVPVIGLFLTFNANKKGDGKNYLIRLISLHFLIGIRYFILTLLLAIPVGLITSLIPDQAVKGFLHGGFVAGMGIAFYYSLASSVRRVSKAIPKTETINNVE